jgi:hypothetical protein
MFAEHQVDLGAADAEHVIAAQLRETGLVTFGGLGDRAAVLGLASRLMGLAGHRDSDPDGLTTIHDVRRQRHRPGFEGLGHGPLALHTEGSSLPTPPRLMLMVCERPAERGGWVLLADGRDVHADLADRDPEALFMLSRPRTVFFGTGAGHPAQVFTPHPDSRVSVRLRQDGLAQWSPLLRPYVPRLAEAALRAQRGVLLAAGQGYLVDNHRWLHARTEFTGARRCLRALGEPRFELARGFGPGAAGAIGPPTTEAA